MPVPALAFAALLAVRCTTPQPPLVTDREVYQPPDLAEPAARVPFRDPVFGTCVTRLTDRTRDIAAEDTSRGMKTEYSRAQPFNADESKVLVRGTSATWYLYDARTLAPLGLLPFGGSVDPRWDATDPNVLYYLDEATTRLVRYSVAERTSVLAHDFASDFPGEALYDVTTGHEGSPSVDGRTWGLLVRNTSYETIAFVVYDVPSSRVVAKRDVRSIPGAGAAESGTISPLGTRFVAQFDICEAGTLGTDAHPCGLMVYGRDLQNGRGLIRTLGHGDLALDASGREVMVFQDVDTDHIAMLDLESGARTALWPIDFGYTAISFHLSGRATSRPGWAVVSTTDGDKASHTWMDDEVFLVELAAGGRVVRVAHDHTLVDTSQEHDYWAEPHATANRDLTKVLFTSNWGRRGTEEVDTYLVELPSGWWNGGSGGTHSAHVSAVAHAPGALGSLWRSDVAVLNRGSAPAALQVTFTPTGGAPQTRSATLGPSATLEWSDVLASLFGTAANDAASGPLAVSSDQPLVLTSRTYNQTAAGTYGGFLAGVAAGLSPGRKGYLAPLRRSASYRTNVGVSNLGGAELTAVVRLWGEDGQRLGADVRVTVPAGALRQVDDVFGAAGAGDAPLAFATLEVETPGASAWAFASVIDNATGDPTMVPLAVP